MLDRWVDIELVRRENDAAQCAADVCADYAEHRGPDPTYGLSAWDDSSREQADDETENDQPDDVQNYDETPLTTNDGRIARPPPGGGSFGYRVSGIPNLKLHCLDFIHLRPGGRRTLERMSSRAWLGHAVTRDLRRLRAAG